MSTAPAARRRGRPVSVGGPSTRDRLLAAAAAECIERGFEGATVGSIAQRAGVTTGAIYNHFAGKADLLVEAGRRALEGIGAPGAEPDAAFATRSFLAPAFAGTRRLLVELHLAALRHPDLAALLGAWHRDQARRWTDGGTDLASVKAFFLLLNGCCQVDSLASLAVPAARLEERIQVAVQALFPEEGP